MLARFPATPASDLPLFPRDYTNPTGTGTYNEGTFTGTHRKWVDSIAGKLVTTVTGRDGQPREQVFDRLAVVPYAYRHSYAQRHADKRVPPDVLRDLLTPTSPPPRSTPTLGNCIRRARNRRSPDHQGFAIAAGRRPTMPPGLHELRVDPVWCMIQPSNGCDLGGWRAG